VETTARAEATHVPSAPARPVLTRYPADLEKPDDSGTAPLSLSYKRGQTTRHAARAPSLERVRAVCQALCSAHGSPRHGNPTNPFDDLIYILLSNRTTARVASRVYENLKTSFPTGAALLEASEAELLSVLAPAGLAKKRTAHLRAIVARLQSDFGSVGLDSLADWPNDRAEAYLCTLPGVSSKVAKCVLMYGLGRRLLPVDVHVHRIATRLGWIRHRRADQSHDSLEALVPAELRYGFHVNALVHGRSVCTAGTPRCGGCVVQNWCDFFRAGHPAQLE